MWGEVVTTLRDLARQIVSVHEGELLQREKVILELRKALKKVKEELAAAKNRRLNIRPPKACEHCVYKVVATKVLEAEEKVKK